MDSLSEARITSSLQECTTYGIPSLHNTMLRSVMGVSGKQDRDVMNFR